MIKSDDACKVLSRCLLHACAPNGMLSFFLGGGGRVNLIKPVWEMIDFTLFSVLGTEHICLVMPLMSL